MTRENMTKKKEWKRNAETDNTGEKPKTFDLVWHQHTDESSINTLFPLKMFRKY